ncbi:hypothetical protein AVEN_200762-1 [Araneus ventricosus]|uniref:Uncharacterized protein n=1 Tax=Araneus ventricosus TaxID=182803 RepID=A0A4Y2DVZ3_ARAVE|nr:hypothetical protein AVEN_200762-1 [Araneus ventricosus]
MTSNVLFIFPKYCYVSSLLSAFLSSVVCHHAGIPALSGSHLEKTPVFLVWFMFCRCLLFELCQQIPSLAFVPRSRLANGSRLPAGISAQLKEVRFDILKSILTLSRPFPFQQRKCKPQCSRCVSGAFFLQRINKNK